MKESTKTVTKLANILFVIGLVAFFLLYLLSTIWQETLILEFISGTGLLVLFSVFIVVPKRDLFLPLLLIFVSMMIVGFTSSSPYVLWIGIREMRAVTTLVLLIGIVSWIINYRPYVKALMLLGRNNITTPSRFFSLIAVITHFISSFMTVGGVPFAYQMFGNLQKSPVSKLAYDFTVSTAIIRGFSLTVLWTAVHPAFAYAIAGTHAELFPTMMKGLGLVCIGFLLSIFIYHLQIGGKGVTVEVIPDLDAKTEEEQHLGLEKEFLFWVILLMGGIFITNQWLQMDILLAVPLVIVMVTTLYFISKRAMKQYIQLWHRFFTVDIGNKKKEVFLMLSAGILVGTLKETGAGQTLFTYFLTILEWMNINILIGLTFVVILLGICGFPPIPAMVLLSGIMGHFPGSYSSELVALSLLLGVSVKVFTAPVTVPLLLLSSMNGRTVAENGVRWNFLFGVALLTVGLLYIQVLTRM